MFPPNVFIEYSKNLTDIAVEEDTTDLYNAIFQIAKYKKKPAKEIVSACIDQGVLFLTAKDKVRLLPALNISMEDLEFAIQTIIEVAGK